MMTPAELGAELGDLTHDQVLALRRQHNWPSWKAGKVIRFTEEHVEQIKTMHTGRPKGEVDLGGPTLVLGGQTKRSARRSSP